MQVYCTLYIHSMQRIMAGGQETKDLETGQGNEAASYQVFLT